MLGLEAAAIARALTWLHDAAMTDKKFKYVPFVIGNYGDSALNSKAKASS
ncbi:hypothetical protein ACVWWG_004182 [Bradyrhizobium sp. LB7.2]